MPPDFEAGILSSLVGFLYSGEVAAKSEEELDKMRSMAERLGIGIFREATAVVNSSSGNSKSNQPDSVVGSKDSDKDDQPLSGKLLKGLIAVKNLLHCPVTPKNDLLGNFLQNQ